MRTELGKIGSVSIGMGGYQEAMFGISFVLEGKGWGVVDFWGGWANKPDKHCKWTEQDQIKWTADAFLKLKELMESAKVSSADKLKGKPVEVTFENQTLRSWRILTEVI